MEPTLAVIGLNYRTSPVAVRERFWMSVSRRAEALQHLVRSEGVEEVVILTTCNRTEFILWASDVPTAANSVLRFLTQEYQLKLCEWSHFYRLMDDVALTHVFRVACSLDSMVLGEAEITEQVRNAWIQAQQAGTTGRVLDDVISKALSVSHRARTETSLNSAAVYLPSAAVELSQEVLGDLAGREVLLIGAGSMNELAAYYLSKGGATCVKVMSRTLARAEEFGRKFSVSPVPWEDRLQHFKTADIVVSSTACPHFILSRQEAEEISRARSSRALVMIDIAVPRDIDPGVQEVEGIHLFDIDDLERVVRRNPAAYRSAAEAAEKIVLAEASDFRSQIAADRRMPAVLALRARIDQLCQEELQVLRQELGPFTDDQEQTLSTLTAHITQRIAGSFARNMKKVSASEEQEIFSSEADRLFQLEPVQRAVTSNKN